MLVAIDDRKYFTQISKDLEDAKLLEAYHAHLVAGASPQHALELASSEVGTISRGKEGNKKALNRARARARKRGYVDPLAPLIPPVPGVAAKPKVLVRDFAKRGRPKKGRQPA